MGDCEDEEGRHTLRRAQAGYALPPPPCGPWLPAGDLVTAETRQGGKASGGGPGAAGALHGLGWELGESRGCYSEGQSTWGTILSHTPEGTRK